MLAQQPDYEVITINTLPGKLQRRKFQGRDYLVVNATLLSEGVLAGSRGPLYYPSDEIASNPGVWNHVPIVVWHPKDANGNPTLARSPEVLEQYGIGLLFNDRYSNNKRYSEAWFDESRTAHFDKQLTERNKLLPRILAGQPVDLSTGLFTDNHPAPSGAVWNSDDGKTQKPYTHIARNYRPDHLAALPDQKGACSVIDGCGFNVNSSKIDWKQIGDELTKSGLMPGYGQIFLNDENEDVLDEAWYVGGDGDEEGFSKKVESKLRSAGVKKVTYESEGFPPRDQSWVQVYPKKRAWVTNEDTTLELNNQHRSANTGQFKTPSAGTGKDPWQSAAQHGAMVLVQDDYDDGKDALNQVTLKGHNPVSWVADEGKWEKAKKAAHDSGHTESEGDKYWAVVSHIYKQMGGKKKPKSVTNSQGKTMDDRTYFITNCECDNKSALLSNMSEDELKAWRAFHSTAKRNEQVVNSLPEHGLTVNSEGEIEPVENESKCPKCGSTMKEGKCEKCGYMMKKKGTMPMATGNVDFTDPKVRDAVCNAAFGMNYQESQVVVNSAKKIEQRERWTLVHKLTANMKDETTRKAKITELLKQPTGNLELLVSLIPDAPVIPTGNAQEDEATKFLREFYTGNAQGNNGSNRPSYEGSQGVPSWLAVNRGNVSGEDKPDVDGGPREMPTLNYDEVSPAGKKIRDRKSA